MEDIRGRIIRARGRIIRARGRIIRARGRIIRARGRIMPQDIQICPFSEPTPMGVRVTECHQQILEAFRALRLGSLKEFRVNGGIHM
jgi:hypothetical protein